MHEYSEIGIHLNLIFSISKQNFEKCNKIFDFWKMSGFSSKNVRELGSQVPDFLHVWKASGKKAYSKKASCKTALGKKASCKNASCKKAPF